MRHVARSDYEPSVVPGYASSAYEVARFPTFGDTSSSIWRLTVSDVKEGTLGPIPGKECTIGLLNGAGLQLSRKASVAPSDCVELCDTGDVHTIPSDDEEACLFLHPLERCVQVFTMQTDRVRASHRVNLLRLDSGQPGLEAFPEAVLAPSSQHGGVTLVLFCVRGSAKAYFPRLVRLGGQMCLCADCLGEDGNEGFRVGEGEALVLEPGKGIAVAADGVPALVVAMQIRQHPGKSASKL